MLTIGGWSGSVYFSDLVSTSKKRAACVFCASQFTRSVRRLTQSAPNRFANTIKTWLRVYGFKGVDLDWEFGASSSSCTRADARPLVAH